MLNLDESTLSAHTQTHMHTFSHRVYAACRCDSVYHSFFSLSISLTNSRVHDGYVFVAGTETIPGHQRQGLLSPSLIFNACVLRLDLGLYSHPNE